MMKGGCGLLKGIMEIYNPKKYELQVRAFPPVAEQFI